VELLHVFKLKKNILPDPDEQYLIKKKDIGSETMAGYPNKKYI
jgi:hypothetical protein